MMGNAAAGFIAMRHGFHGPAFAVVSACAAGTDAIGVAVQLVRAGIVDVALTGGAESSLTRFSINSFAAMEATSTSGISRPFDVRRDGFVLSEGAGVMVIESEASAAARGAAVVGEILGYGASADAYHLVAPDPTGAGAVLALERALEDAGLTPADIDYVNAHGTSTPLNDRAETLALKQALGPDAYEIPVSSTKSAIGHLLGAAGAVEAIATLQALAARTAPPTLNHEQPEEGLDLDYVPLRAKPMTRSTGPAAALSNSFGFGGHNSVLCLGAAS
jgi:3-oxoacyl-[acyl-carrier-protein] synthase II